MLCINNGFRNYSFILIVLISAFIPSCITSSSTTSIQAVHGPYKVFDPPRPSGTFAYAPSSISLPNNDYHFYCGNRGNNEIIDHIYLRHYQFNNGRWNVVRDSIVLSPSPNRWDSRHVCDPEVVAGKFSLNNKTYNWAMFYTGTIDPNNNGTQNSLGVAFSNDLINWVKRPDPVVLRNNNGWGVGLPSVTSVNGAGQILLFYTRSNPTITFAQYLDLSNANVPKVLKPEWMITASGTVNNVLQHASFVYDPFRDRFYISASGRYDTKSPSFITVSEEILWISGSSIWSGTGRWRSMGFIDKALTRKEKNHNSGIQRNPLGHIPDRNQLRINFTGSNSTAWPQALFTYRIHSVHIRIPN